MSPRLNEFTTKIQFASFNEMPAMVYRACIAAKVPSNTRYYQEAVCEKLSRDLGIPLEELISRLPPPKGKSKVLFGADRRPLRNTGETDAAVG